MLELSARSTGASGIAPAAAVPTLMKKVAAISLFILSLPISSAGLPDIRDAARSLYSRIGLVQAAERAIVLLPERRYVMKPTPAKPRSIIAQVENSGTAATFATVKSIKSMTVALLTILTDVTGADDVNPINSVVSAILGRLA
jgi:hypothetical protein